MSDALTAAEFVPGVSEVEISAALGSEVLLQFEDVKSALSTLIKGLNSIHSSIEGWMAKPDLSGRSIKTLLAGMFAGSTAASAAVKGLFENTKLDPAPVPVQSSTAQLEPPSTTSTSTSSSTSQKVSPYVFLTQKGTSEGDLDNLLGSTPARRKSFNALKVQLVALNLTDSMAKEFSTNPIVSLAFSEYEIYC